MFVTSNGPHGALHSERFAVLNITCSEMSERFAATDTTSTEKFDRSTSSDRGQFRVVPIIALKNGIGNKDAIGMKPTGTRAICRRRGHTWGSVWKSDAHRL